MKVTVLGAGYMGSAMATVARMRGHDVRLWGTWLDDALLDPCARGEAHPRLKLTLDGHHPHRSAALAQALAGADLVVHAVSSEGAVPVMTKAAPLLPDVPVLSVSKGSAHPRRGRWIASTSWSPRQSEGPSASFTLRAPRRRSR